MSEIISRMEALLANKAFYEVFYQDMQSSLNSALAFCQDIDNLLLLARSLEFDQIDSILYGLQSNVNHIVKMVGMMANPALAMLYDGQRLAEPERLQVKQIKAIGQKLFGLIRRAIAYFKLLSETPDQLKFKDTDLRPLFESTKTTLSTLSREITLIWLNDHIVTFADSMAVREILYNLCMGWLESVPDVQVQVVVSKDQQLQMAKLVFTYDRLSISLNELKNKLVPSLAMDNNTFDLIITTRLIDLQNGRFESQLAGQRLMFTVYLPLAQESTVV